jgi:hypothetical protein
MLLLDGREGGLFEFLNAWNGIAKNESDTLIINPLNIIRLKPEQRPCKPLEIFLILSRDIPNKQQL